MESSTRERIFRFSTLELTEYSFGHLPLDIVHGNLAAQLARHRSDASVANPAGDNGRKGPKVHVDVERESMRRNPAAEMHTQRGDLVAIYPDARAPGDSRTRNPEWRDG